jgi:hypothetical protein
MTFLSVALGVFAALGIALSITFLVSRVLNFFRRIRKLEDQLTNVTYEAKKGYEAFLGKGFTPDKAYEKFALDDALDELRHRVYALEAVEMARTSKKRKK